MAERSETDMKYSAEEFSKAGDPFLGRSYEEMDCQKLVERILAVVGRG